MLIALPIAVFFVIIILLHSRRSGLSSGSNWRASFLLAAIIWGTILVGITEGLSLFKAITRPNVAILWLIALAILISLGLRWGSFRSLVSKLKSMVSGHSSIEWSIVIAMGVILAILGLIAWLAPSNTTDSLLYHLPRVAHWIQGSSLEHYPTAYQNQLWASPFAEMSILNFQLLWGGDQPANMIQWFFFLGSLIGVSGIAKLLGSGRIGQLLAAAYAISIPVGILQSTSTQTDLVTSFWLICLSYFVVLGKKSSLSRLELFSLGLSFGLGVLTKGTFYPLALPILVWYFLMRLRGNKLTVVFREGLTLGLIVLLLNLGFWARNIASFGGPLGPREAVELHSELSLVPANWISTILHHVIQNYATPWEGVNHAIASSVNAFDRIVGSEIREFELVWAWNQEDYAGNPVHLTILLFTVLGISFFIQKYKTNVSREYSWVTLATILTFGVVVLEGYVSIRLQVPILLLGAPLVGIALSNIKSRRIYILLLSGFLFISLPWILFNSTRPVIAMRARPEPWAMPCTLGCTRTGSIFFRAREDLMFANWPDFQEPITAIAERIEKSGCRLIGLQLDSRDREYLFWWSLNAPNEQLHIESISTYPELEKYLDHSYKPCAVICTTCGYRTQAYGLDLAYNRQLLSLFMGDKYVPEIDP